MTKWDDRHLNTAKRVAEERSKDPSTKVGAVLVSPFGAEILNSFNGIPMGVEDTQDRLERPAKYLFTAHAEANLISFAARHGIRTDGCSVYITHPPCADCAKLMIQAGIRQVKHYPGRLGGDWGESMGAAYTMLQEAEIRCEEVPHPT